MLRHTEEENSLSVAVEPGDLLLFSRQCSSMDILSCLICCAAKLASGRSSGYDHIGIVVRDTDSQELKILEANVGGVTLRSLRERLQRTRCTRLAVRKIVGEKPVEFEEELFQLAKGYLSLEYNSSFLDMFGAWWASSTATGCNADWSEIASLQFNHSLLEKHLKDCSVARHTTLHSILLQQKDDKEKEIRNKAASFSSKCLGYSIISDSAPSSPSTPVKEESLSGVYCSQLVGAIYREMDILNMPRSKSLYIPKEFSSLEQSDLPLREPYKFSPDFSFDPKGSAKKHIANANTMSVVVSGITIKESPKEFHIVSRHSAEDHPWLTLNFGPGNVLTVKSPLPSHLRRINILESHESGKYSSHGMYHLDLQEGTAHSHTSSDDAPTEIVTTFRASSRSIGSVKQLQQFSSHDGDDATELKNALGQFWTFLKKQFICGSSLSESDHAHILSGSRIVRHQPGELLTLQRCSNSPLYILLRGTICCEDLDGNAVNAEPGSVVNAESLIGSPSLRAWKNCGDEESVVLAIDRSSLLLANVGLSPLIFDHIRNSVLSSSESLEGVISRILEERFGCQPNGCQNHTLHYNIKRSGIIAMSTVSPLTHHYADFNIFQCGLYSYRTQCEKLKGIFNTLSNVKHRAYAWTSRDDVCKWNGILLLCAAKMFRHAKL